jgi:PKD repeat protein
LAGWDYHAGTAGKNDTGDGGAGGGADHAFGGRGGSGIVILRYNVSSGVTSPVASFTANRTENLGPEPQSIKFTDTSTNTPTGWGWNMTELNTTRIQFSTSQNPEQVFYYGNWSITLIASNAGGSNISTQTTWENVSMAPPVASFTANRTGDLGYEPQAVQLNDTSSGNPTGWNWYQKGANGTEILFSSFQNLSYTFMGDNWSVWLQATNAGGSGNSSSVWMNVSAIPKFEVSFICNRSGDVGTDPQAILFNDTSTGGPPTEWGWNMTSPGGVRIAFSDIQNATYAFPLGNWSISLNASNAWWTNYSRAGCWVNVTWGNVSACAVNTACANPSSEPGYLPVGALYVLIPLAAILSIYAVSMYDNRIYANIVLGGFTSSVLWFFLAANIITGNVFYSANNKFCTLSDIPLFWVFMLLGVVMSVYTLALALEAVTERRVNIGEE